MTRLHVVGLPHTGLEDRFSWCAYTGKVRRFAPMMTRLGYDVTTYHAGYAEQRESWQAGEYVCVLDEAQRVARFGRTGLPVPTFGDSTFWEFNSRTIHEITQRIQPGDLVCVIAGLAQVDIVNAFPGNGACEFGVGYVGVIPDGTFRAFESYAWMHAVYGNQADNDLASYVGRNYDAVIPNYFDPADFPLRVSDDGYLLYLARCDSWLKGIDTARAVAEATGIRLVTAGAGPAPKGCDHRGIVGPAERAELLTHCTALIQPTAFLEPFGGSVVEALLSGVPVITTDWGAFPENVVNPHMDGRRCRTLAEFVDAVRWAQVIGDAGLKDRQKRAQARWSMDAVGPQFDRWFRQIADLDRKGWYQLDERGTDG